METFKEPRKRKLRIGIIVYVAICSLLVICWMTFMWVLEKSDFLVYNLGGQVIKLVYKDELEWMAGKSAEEIEARFGPMDILHKHPDISPNENSRRCYYVWWDWIIEPSKNEGAKVRFDYSYYPSLDIEHPFRIQDWEIKYYILNFVGAVFISFGAGAVVFLICRGIKRHGKNAILLICNEIKRHGKPWQTSLDADQSWQKNWEGTDEME